MMLGKEEIQGALTMYQSMPFDHIIGYESEGGGPIDMSDWVGRLVFRANVEAPDELLVFSTDAGTMVLGVGTIRLIAPAANRSWKQAVGHLVVGPTPETASPIAFLGIANRPSTTGTPS